MMVNLPSTIPHGAVFGQRRATLYGILFMASVAFAGPRLLLRQEYTTTVLVPHGTSNHGDPSLLCTPSKWTDVATFLLANYAAHAATVGSQPGDSVFRNGLTMLIALFFPVAGVVQGLDAIMHHAITARCVI